MICNINDSITEGIKNYVDRELDRSKLFNRDEEGNYIVKEQRGILYKFPVQDINNDFGENILIPSLQDKYKYILNSPSEKLLSLYRLKDDPSSSVRIKLPELDINNQKEVFKAIGIKDETSSVKDVVTNMLSNQFPDAIKTMYERNPTVKMEWSTTGKCTYDQFTNTVAISPEEIYDTAKKGNLDFSDVFKILSLHEIAHGTYDYGSMKGSNDVILEKIRKRLLEIHQNEVPFEDGLRQGYEENGIPYSLKNTFEMVADAKSNPWFQKWASQFESDIEESSEPRSFIKRIYDRVLEIFGISKAPSLYDQVINIVNDKGFIQAQTEMSEGFRDNSENKFITMNGMPANWFNATHEIFTSEDVAKDMESLYDDLIGAKYKLTKYMDWETDKTQIKKLNSIIEAFTKSKDVKEKASCSINMLEQGSRLCSELLTQVELIKAMPSGEKKLKMSLAVQNMAHAIDDGIAEIAAKASNIISNDGEKILLDRIDKLKEKGQELTNIANSKSSTEEQVLKARRELLEVDKDIIDTRKSWAATKKFRQNLDGIAATPKRIKTAMAEELIPSQVEWLAKSVRTNEAILSKKEEIQSLKKDIEKEQEKAKNGGIPDFKKVQLLSKRIATRESELKRMPSQETFTDILHGCYQDANQMEMNLDAPIANSHPLLGTLAEMVRLQDVRTAQLMSGAANIHDSMLQEWCKAKGIKEIRDTTSTYKPLKSNYEFVKEFEEDENGNIKPKSYITQGGLLSSYHPDYIKEAYTRKMAIDYYYKEWDKAKNAKDDVKKELYENKLDEARAEKNRWEDENSERLYKPEVYEMYKMLETPLTKEDGESTTFSKERNFLYNQREQAENGLLSADMDQMQKHIDAIKAIDIEIRQLKSDVDKYGNPKTGFELNLSQIAKKYSDLQGQYGEFTLTDNGKVMWESHLMQLKKKFELGELDEKTYLQKKGEICVTEPSDMYYATRQYLSKNLEDLKQNIINIEEVDPNNPKNIIKPFENVFNSDKQKNIEESQTWLQNITLGFKDNDKTIDGVLFSQIRPELIKQINDRQTEMEQMKQSILKLKTLSGEEGNRFRQLATIKKEELTNDEKLEFDNLKAKLSSIKERYKKYKQVIDDYDNTLKRLMLMSNSTETHYYIEECDRQKAIIRKNLLEEWRNKLQNNRDENFANGEYKKVNGEWMKVLSRSETGEVNLQALQIEGFLTSGDAMVEQIVNPLVEDSFKESDWYKQNHYQKEGFDPASLEYTNKDVPIYIWMKSSPSDARYMKPDQPSSMYKSFKIKDEFMNANYKLLNDKIAVPKAGKYINEEYNNLDEDSKKYLEFLRANYYKSQEYIPEAHRLVDILPSFAKTHDENKVELTKHVKDKAIDLLGKATKKADSEDESIQWGGSNSDYNARNRVLPVRFTSKMDISRQSSDLPAMLLGFQLASIQYSERAKDQPLFESIRQSVENLSVTGVKNLASNGLSVTNIIPAVTNFFSRQKTENETKPSSKTYTKDVQETNLKKGVDFILNTFQYDHFKDANTITLNGQEYDLNQMSTQLKNASTLSIFMGNLFGALKVTGTGYIQGVINGNVGKGYYTRSQYNKAYGEATMMIDSFIKDFSKFGNKTKIGQELEYFQVVNGISYNEYGHKTAFTALKAAPSFLMAFKGASEFTLQLAQYLAMSKANPVKMADGKFVEWRDAFEIDKNTNSLKPKQGAEISQQDINRFSGRLSSINRNINGAHRAIERNAFQKNILGDLAFYLNGHIVQGITNRFSGTRWSNDGDMISRGYYKEAAGFVSDCFKWRQGIGETWNTLNQEEKARCWRTVWEVGMVLALSGICFALGSEEKKEQLKTHSSMENWALALGLGVKGQFETLIPLPGLGLEDAVRKMNSPFAAMRQVTNITKLASHFGLFCIDQPDAFFTTQPYDDGLHNIGSPKFIADFAKLCGWSGMGFDALNRVQQVRISQELR